MKIELNDNSMWTIIWVTTIVAVCTLWGYGCHEAYEAENTKVKEGMSQKQVPNTMTYIWSH